MTNRNRRARRPAARGRTARLVWVNQFIDVALGLDSINIIDMLVSAVDFMTFDTTIVSVKIPWLSVSNDAAAVEGIRAVSMALIVAPDAMDADDFTQLHTNSIGPPWLYYTGQSARFAATAQQITFDLVQNPGMIDVKANRRFRENDSTLWMLIQNDFAAGDANLNVRGFCRTLLRIP